MALAGNLFFLPRVLPAWVGLNLGYRFVISGMLLVPLGFVMGMPFPTGLRALGARSGFDIPSAASTGTTSEDNAVEWAWAMNAAASVLGSVLAMVIAIQFGLTVTLACGAAAYLFALLLLPALRRSS
jgi:hypothetical protein